MPGPKGQMNDEARNFAVSCFARYMSPTQVAEAVNERFGISIDKRQAQHYDPTKSSGRDLSKARRLLFDQVRARFLKDLEDIPIANRSVRLQQLQVHYDKMVGGKMPNIRMALDILEKASKEAGNFHSNEKHVHHTGKLQVEEVTEDEMRNGLAAAIAQALDDARTRAGEAAAVTKH